MTPKRRGWRTSCKIALCHAVDARDARWPLLTFQWSRPNSRGGGGGGGGYFLCDGWYICAAVLTPGFDPLFSPWQDRARSFWGIFSHPPTPKRSFGVLKLPILTEFDLLGPKFHFSLDLFGSNFQRPAAHPHHFSDRVPPPPPPPQFSIFNDYFRPKFITELICL